MILGNGFIVTFLQMFLVTNAWSTSFKNRAKKVIKEMKDVLHFKLYLTKAVILIHALISR